MGAERDQYDRCVGCLYSAGHALDCPLHPQSAAPGECSPMGTNARGVAQCSEGHGDYPDACEEARA